MSDYDLHDLALLPAPSNSQLWIKSMNIFILEDSPERVACLSVMLKDHQHTVIDSCTQADKFQPPYDLILLDHDLGGRQLDSHEDCGLTFLRMVKARLDKDATIIIHSYNPDGANAMRKELEGFENVAIAPFGGSYFNNLVNARIWSEKAKESENDQIRTLQGCKHLGPEGCTVKALSCKLWLCDEMERKPENRQISADLYKLNTEAARAGIGLRFRGAKCEYRLD